MLLELGFGALDAYWSEVGPVEVIEASDRIAAMPRMAVCDPRRLGQEIRAENPRSGSARIIGSPDRVGMSPDDLWTSPRDRVISDAIEDLVLFLRHQGFQISEGYGAFDLDYYSSYLRQSVARVCALVDLLDTRVTQDASILDVGAYLGSFALPLARLGFKVTAVDQYDQYGTSFDSVRSFLADSGIETVGLPDEVTAVDLAGTGSYHCAISMAVIEHLPHTPRTFIEALCACVGPGGFIAVDTPNLVRWHNREAFREGESIFQDLGHRYWGQPPYRGHHMEFTPHQVAWMLEQAGCSGVEIRMLNYNPVQWDQIVAGPHVDALVATVDDPSLADTILAIGQLGSPDDH